MGCGVGSKEKRGHDLRHYCNSSHYSTFFNFRGLQPKSSSNLNRSNGLGSRTIRVANQDEIITGDFPQDIEAVGSLGRGGQPEEDAGPDAIEESLIARRGGVVKLVDDNVLITSVRRKTTLSPEPQAERW